MKPIFFFSFESLTLTIIDRLTITQRKIIKTYYKKGDSAKATYRALRAGYGNWQNCEEI